MTKTVKERLINALIGLGLGVIFSFIVLQISFHYTREVCIQRDTDYQIVIDKLDFLIQKVDTLK